MVVIGVKRPNVSIKDAETTVWDLYGIKALNVKEFDSHQDRNFYIEDSNNSSKFVLKIYAEMCSETELLWRLNFMNYVNNKGFVCPTTVSTNDGKILNYKSFGDSSLHPVVLMTFIPGICLSKLHPLNASVWYDVGYILGSLHQSLREFQSSIPTPSVEEDPWSLENMRYIPDYINTLQLDTKGRSKDKVVALQFINEFQQSVVPVYSELTKGLIHRDMHDDNIILRDFSEVTSDSVNLNQSPLSKYGILDFGDAIDSFNVFDLAIAMAYSIFSYKSTPDSQYPDSIERAGHLLAGYLSVTSLNSTERDVLYSCTCCRIIQDIACAEHDYAFQSEANEYLVSCVDIGWKCLHELEGLGKLGFYSVLQTVLNEHGVFNFWPVDKNL